MSKDKQLEALFDKAALMSAFKEGLPRFVEYISDLFEKRPPKITKKDEQELFAELSKGFDSMADLVPLEALKGDPSRRKEAYRIFEGWLKKSLQQNGQRLRLQEDAFDYLLRKQFEMLKVPAAVKRRKQFRVVRQGLEVLIVAVLNTSGGWQSAQQLIEEYQQKHMKEDMRFVNSFVAREAHYQNIMPKRITSRVITKLADEYQHISAAFERRLRLLIGLNCIVRGNPSTWDKLRKIGYNGLLQAVDSPANPLLHFLKDSVDRNVRNVLMHGGTSFSPAKKTVSFIDYSPAKGVEREVVWTVSKFYRKTKNLTLTMATVSHLEILIAYIRLYSLNEYFRSVGIK